LLLWAHLAVLADVATLLGARRWQGSVLAAALALLVTQMPGAERWRGLALAAGGGALLLVLVAAGTAMGITPWAAWREAAGRPARASVCRARRRPDPRGPPPRRACRRLPRSACWRRWRSAPARSSPPASGAWPRRRRCRSRSRSAPRRGASTRRSPRPRPAWR